MPDPPPFPPSILRRRSSAAKKEDPPPFPPSNNLLRPSPRGLIADPPASSHNNVFPPPLSPASMADSPPFPHNNILIRRSSPPSMADSPLFPPKISRQQSSPSSMADSPPFPPNISCQRSSPAMMMDPDQKFVEEMLAMALFSPFFVCMAAGTLPMEDFHGFIAQDRHILKAFSRAYVEVGFLAAREHKAALQEMILDSMLLLKSFYSMWGFELAKHNSTLATTKYTDFIIATASGNVAGKRGLPDYEITKVATVGTMAPFLDIHLYLAKKMDTILNPNYRDYRYRKWIDNYTSAAFEASTSKFAGSLVKLSASFNDYEFDALKKVYLEAFKLRVDFFPSLALSQQSVVPFFKMHDPAKDRLVIFSGFDFTSTVIDSPAFLAQTTMHSVPKTDQYEPEVSCADQKSQKEMKIMLESFLMHKKKCADECWFCMAILSSKKVAQGFKYQDLRKAVEQISSFQKQANSRVTERMVSKGINMELVKRAAEKLPLQIGCMKFFQQVVQRKAELNADIHIISHCLCEDIIKSALLSGGIDSIKIHANQLEFEDGLTTGTMIKKLKTPSDTYKCFKGVQGPSNYLSVYIGSTNMSDLLCMLEADVGIVVGNCRIFERLCKHFGVTLVSLFPGVVLKQRDLSAGKGSWKGLSGVLYKASSWFEIHAFLIGLS